jgi:hypothetical protein
MLFCAKYKFTQPNSVIQFEILENNVSLQSQTLDGRQHIFKHRIDENVARSATITFKMSKKLPSHTLLDAQGNIVSDCAVLIESISFDDIDVTDVYCQGASCYQHDTNGQTSMAVDEFYGFMGYNGSVNIDFDLPIYTWFFKHCE